MRRQENRLRRSRLEGSGPLIGLKGILPAEPDIVQATKPPVYSRSCGSPICNRPMPVCWLNWFRLRAMSKRFRQRRYSLLRVCCGFDRLALIGVILISMAAGVPRLVEPSLSQNIEVVTASQFIAGLPAGVPVLVVVDYAPGFSGDVSPLLASVVDHLATKNESVALVSTLAYRPVAGGEFASPGQSTPWFGGCFYQLRQPGLCPRRLVGHPGFYPGPCSDFTGFGLEHRGLAKYPFPGGLCLVGSCY